LQARCKNGIEQNAPTISNNNSGLGKYGNGTLKLGSLGLGIRISKVKNRGWYPQDDPGK
jgi:hypothetical protein